MNQAFQILIERNEHIPEILDYIYNPENMELIQLKQADNIYRIIFDATEEQLMKFSTLIGEVCEKLERKDST